jgi:4-aminobutyrate aminotransferase-like enzyme
MNTRQTLDLLRKYESQNITFIDPRGGWPIVWDLAQGVWVWDGEGRKYLDLTAAFGVAAAGHANRAVVKAGKAQMDRLLHAMGDVHPHALKAKLSRTLSGLTFERWKRGLRGKTIFCNSGFEAVEAALKTSTLATGRSGVIGFKGAYHGVGYGALNVTHREHFWGPFRSQIKAFGKLLPFPAGPDELAKLEQQLVQVLRKGKVGAVLVEPVQARGGIRIPPHGFLKLLRRVCDAHGVLLVLDEIYTGFGRTGKWFACEHERVVPDIVCVGKALTGGFPLSACIGRAGLMDKAWPPSDGEAIHTSTFLGHPVGCAMALAQIGEIERLGLVERSAALGTHLLKRLSEMAALHPESLEARGLGLLAGLEFRTRENVPDTATVLRLTKTMLKKGFILLPEGAAAEVLSFTPPLVIRRRELDGACDALFQLIEKL